VAQLGARMNGIHEVRGSIPLSSTKEKKGGMKYGPLFCATSLKFQGPSSTIIPLTHKEIGTLRQNERPSSKKESLNFGENKQGLSTPRWMSSD
jgi:hypothetical protein